MTAQQLRNSILQAAIQGKLVPQDPAEGNAADLLAEIHKEKERLVKEGKLKKKDLAVEPISDDEKPFDIPETWEWVRWGELSFFIQYGFNAPAKTVGRIKMVRISDIHDNSIDWNSVPYCDIEEKDIPNYLLKENDILFARTGGTVGKSYIVSSIKEEAIYAGYLIRTQYSSQLCPLYLKYFMESSLYWAQLREGTIATAQPNCNGKVLAKMVLPLPPLAEQKRIVAKLEELLPLVDKYGKAQEELDKLNKDLPQKLRQSILQNAIQGKLVPQDPEEGTAAELLQKFALSVKLRNNRGKDFSQDLFDLPDNWMWAPFKQCAEVLYGFPFNSQLFVDIPQGMPLIRIRDVIPACTRTFTTERADDRYIISKGDMLVGMDGNFNVNFWNSSDAYLNQRVCKVIANEKVVLQKYLYYYLPIVFDEISSNVSYCTVKHLADTHFNLIRIPLPPLAEQKRIVAKIEELFAEIDKLK